MPDISIDRLPCPGEQKNPTALSLLRSENNPRPNRVALASPLPPPSAPTTRTIPSTPPTPPSAGTPSSGPSPPSEPHPTTHARPLNPVNPPHRRHHPLPGRLPILPPEDPNRRPPFRVSRVSTPPMTATHARVASHKDCRRPCCRPAHSLHRADDEPPRPIVPPPSSPSPPARPRPSPFVDVPPRARIVTSVPCSCHSRATRKRAVPPCHSRATPVPPFIGALPSE